MTACQSSRKELKVLQFNIWQEGTSVENGYWAFCRPSLPTLLLLLALGRVRMRGFGAEMFRAIGMNTFGIYMLHMAGLILLCRAQDTSLFNGLGNLNSIALTVVNVLLCICVFAGCLFITVLLRKIPFIKNFLYFDLVKG